jgi:hypothetical protein
MNLKSKFEEIQKEQSKTEHEINQILFAFERKHKCKLNVYSNSKRIKLTFAAEANDLLDTYHHDAESIT